MSNVKRLNLDSNRLTRLFIALLDHVEQIENERSINNEAYLRECLYCALTSKEINILAITSHDALIELSHDLNNLIRKGVD